MRVVNDLMGLCERGAVEDLLTRVKSLSVDRRLVDASRLSAREAQSADILHDLLDALAMRMIKLNREKAEAAGLFIREVNTLTAQCDQDVDRPIIERLKGKTILKKFYGDYARSEDCVPFSRIWRVLKTNGSLFKNLDEDRRRHLSRAYQESHSIIVSVKEQLKETDDLIDQLVVLLYGLL